MWLCLNDAFLSIVQPDAADSNVLRVRARRKGDIQRVFSDAKVERTPGRDYLYRAHVSRALVAEALAAQVQNITYDNFKNSVRDNKLHQAYSDFWSGHARLQEIRPYARDY